MLTKLGIIYEVILDVMSETFRLNKASDAREEIITAIGDNGIVMDDMYTYSYLLPEISQSNRSLASEALSMLSLLPSHKYTRASSALTA